MQQIRAANSCDLCVSPWGSFHPAAVTTQGRTVQCPPDPLFPDEQFLECRGSLEAFAKLFPLLCASLFFPGQSTCMNQHGTEY
jgi:hypothetical protein